MIALTGMIVVPGVPASRRRLRAFTPRSFALWLVYRVKSGGVGMGATFPIGHEVGILRHGGLSVESDLMSGPLRHNERDAPPMWGVRPA